MAEFSLKLLTAHVDGENILTSHAEMKLGSLIDRLNSVDKIVVKNYFLGKTEIELLSCLFLVIILIYGSI